ncbi:MAG: hypothetical protein OXF07_06100 [Rhodobacter sp.]|nr:hypothetical protein [Rhodobacter sp.]MCY4166949.1 hypothetical protein [Rhodobacter sp.]
MFLCMRTLLDGLAALALGAVTLPASPEHAVPMPAKPNETRKRAFGILKVDPAKGVAMQAPGWSRRYPPNVPCLRGDRSLAPPGSSAWRPAAIRCKSGAKVIRAATAAIGMAVCRYRAFASRSERAA